MNLKDRVIIVTGASSGIGESCVLKLLNLNARVAGFDVKPEKIIDQNYKACTVDVRDENSIKAAVDDIYNSYGKIDALVI